ncbi:MAG: zinc-dependent peptidase [Burkholderiales bacterium]|nr:zinc-dependent peptidase [Burkholderiales bacterium]
MLSSFRRWRRNRILARARLDGAVWAAALRRYSFTRALGPEEARLLRERVILFRHDKEITGAGGLEVSEEMRVDIAVQASMLVLGLDLDWYRGFTEVIVYPDEFVVDYEYVDADGVAHHVREPMSGESWLTGPVILSWADTRQADSGGGYNVVMHEFAHKLDMLNGDANGCPPLHAGMDARRWAEDLRAAYEDFSRRVEARAHTRIDPYAAENPAEFFAVLSEAFFEIPEVVHADYPAVYAELAAFYRQDPLARLERAA